MAKFTWIACAAVASLTITCGEAAAFEPPRRTEISVRDAAGVNYGWNSQRGPALSLAKLYLGYWVLYNGSDQDKALVEPMIRTSDDNIAEHLNRTYPSAIADIISDFGLEQSQADPHWGYTQTSMQDATYFVWKIKPDPVAAPILDGMRNASPIAADGYPQNYGTATLPGAEGTKFGWSDNRDINATVSFGNAFTIGARTYGPAEQLTHDVQGVPLPGQAPNPYIPSAPDLSSSTPFGPIQLPQLPALPAFPPLS